MDCSHFATHPISDALTVFKNVVDFGLRHEPHFAGGPLVPRSQRTRWGGVRSSVLLQVSLT